jgi:ammonia channel protein AmtB
MPAMRLTEITTIACLFFIFLVPLAAAGLAIMNVGLGRSRSAGHMMMASLCALAVAGLAYFVCGFSWQGFIGSSAHFFNLSGKSWNWIAAEPFFFRKLTFDGSAAPLAAVFQIFCVGLAALIPLGSGADRWRLRFLRIGCGAADGLRNSASIMESAADFSMSVEPALFKSSAASRPWR